MVIPKIGSAKIDIIFDCASYFSNFAPNKMFTLFSISAKRIYHPVIGEYLIVKNRKSKTMRLSVHSKRGIRIGIPYHVQFTEAEKFVESKIDWIKKALEKQKKREEKVKIGMGYGDEIKIIGGAIQFWEGNFNKIEVICAEGGKWLVYYPLHHKSEEVRGEVIRILQKVSKSYLPARLEYFAQMYGFKYNKLFLKNNISNWGSCSVKSNINLNIHLMRIPQEVCDYVILHELVHLKYRNHGAEFHNALNYLCGGKEKELKKELLRYNPEI